MKRVWGHILLGSTLLCAGGVAFPACAHDDSTLFIKNVLAGTGASAGTQCTFTDDPKQTYLPSGILDVDFARQYLAVFLIGNQTLPRGSPDQTRAETSRITVKGAIVRITDATGAQLATFTRLTSGTVDPATASTPAYLPISAEILDHSTVESYALDLANSGTVVRLVTYTRFFGQTLGGDHVESDEFEFPIDVCRGCLIAFTVQDVDPGKTTPNCCTNPNLQGAGTTNQAVPCFPGQDAYIDCQSCPGLITTPDHKLDCWGLVLPSECQKDAGAG